MIADDSVTIMKQKSKTAHMVETAIEQLTATIDENDKSIKGTHVVSAYNIMMIVNFYVAYNIKIEKLSAPLTKLQQLTDGLRATTKPGGRRSQLYQDLAKQYKEDLDVSLQDTIVVLDIIVKHCVWLCHLRNTCKNVICCIARYYSSLLGKYSNVKLRVK